MFTFCGATVPPGRTRWIPFTITQSPAVTPSATARSPFWTGPSFTGRYSTTFCAFTTRTYFRSWSVPIARSVTRTPGRDSPRGTRTRTNICGTRSRSRLGSTARMWIVPGNGRGHPRELEIEPGQVELRELRLELPLGRSLVGDRSLELAGARRAGRTQRLVADHLGLRPGELRAQSGDVALAPQDGRLVLARVDLEQEVAPVHERAGGAGDLRDETGDARPHLDAVDGAEPAGELERLLDGLLDRLADRDLGRRHRHLRLAPASRRDGDQAPEEHRPCARRPSAGYHCGLHHRQRHQPRSCSVPVLAASAMFRCLRSSSRSPHRVRDFICAAVSLETALAPAHVSQPPPRLL